MKAELDEASAALDAAHRLSEQLDRKESMISALRDEGILNCHIGSANLIVTVPHYCRCTRLQENVK